ncbi:MAG TPA: 16S rRNA (guanine(966)-N(2))-methyltransferase RsmD [Pseudothermotoga sp.]|uniref:16S rRNA (guanine(966)-N(2))-methyltransferase RsmD n=1 Tax=Thermotoga profunda TaxID=1508420 RepID=UPI000596E1AA|nr:16S rRNA (guanine(966)-N(2))-methyltransferase RsmD [Thermotoga profunda]
MKITGGIFKGRELKPVPDKRTRYTTSIVRQAIFNMVDVSNKSFLELFCGSGIVSFEAMSHGAINVVAVDISKKAITTTIENAKKLGVEIRIVNADFRRFLSSCTESFDIVFADPPYNLGFTQVLLNTISEKDHIGKIIILEKAILEKFILPKQFTLVKSKRYGDTELVIVERVPKE